MNFGPILLRASRLKYLKTRPVSKKALHFPELRFQGIVPLNANDVLGTEVKWA
ncbi:hypothetical protein TanjilG_15954 [Lupinus angustifolius]|uniref:Uncharacterized protein n=1 Tax=Lupinus angustifolius TaxID=3871 RepID=A0A4P1RGG3_LUPAN|nr:hypothetical protein TanjilG_15954 [Lupinus angustifolius]